MKKETKKFFVLWLVVISIPMLYTVSMVGNTYTDRTRVDGSIKTVEKEITVSDVLKSLVVFALGTVAFMFWITREPIPEETKKRQW